MPTLGQPKATAPGTGALWLSILGFCGVTALLGVILGFFARSDARKRGLSTGTSNAAIIVGFLWIGLYLLGLSPIFSALTSPSSKPANPPQSPGSHASADPTPADTGDPGMAWVMCQQRMNEILKAPATAGYPLTNEFQIMRSGEVFNMDAWVDAENSFGANLRTYFHCTTHYDGGGTWTTRIATR